MTQLVLPLLDLSYTVKRRERRTIGVVVRPDGSVEVHAPMSASVRSIDEVVSDFAPWIERKRNEAVERQRRRVERRFEDGDEIPFAGGVLTLRVVGAPGGTAAHALRRGDDLVVALPPDLAAAARRTAARHAAMRWMLVRAREVFHRRHVEMSKLTGFCARRVIIKDMRTRWGSCGPNRLMNLNWRLVLAPERVLDYVLAHELMHIEEPNHSRAFWRRVAGVCPHWGDSRRWLRRHGEDLEL